MAKRSFYDVIDRCADAAYVGLGYCYCKLIKSLRKRSGECDKRKLAGDSYCKQRVHFPFNGTAIFAGNIYPGEYIPYLSPFYFNSIRWLSLERVSATRNRHLQWNFVFNFNSDRCVVRISHRFKQRKTLYERESICFIVNPIMIVVLMYYISLKCSSLDYSLHTIWNNCIEIYFVICFFFFFNFDNAIYRENKMKIIKW